jgi:uncharacterized membrane protein YkvA (DUF1232 family)
MAERTDRPASGAQPPSEPVSEAPAPDARQSVEEALAAAAGAAAAVAAAAPEGEHLLAGYDRLRQRVLRAVERRGGKLGADAVRILLLVPDIFLLLVRLTLDRDVPPAARATIASALAYFLLPVDLLPEAVLGAAGYLDDVVLATALVAQAFGGELEPYARKHWSGPEDLRQVLADVSATAHRLLGGRLHDRLHKLTAGKGGKADEEEEE